MGRRHRRTQVFEGVPFFEGCDEGLLADMAPHADRVRVQAGTTLAVAGRHAWQLLVLLDGSARTVEGTRIATLGAGDAVAPAAVATTSPHPATVTALTDVEVLVVNGHAFASAVSRNPALLQPVRRSPAGRATAGASRRVSRVAAVVRALSRPPASEVPLEQARGVHDRYAAVGHGIGR